MSSTYNSIEAQEIRLNHIEQITALHFLTSTTTLVTKFHKIRSVFQIPHPRRSRHSRLLSPLSNPTSPFGAASRPQRTG